MNTRVAPVVVLVTLLSTLVPTSARASYLQLCRLDGEIVSQPEQSDCCVKFKFLVATAESYEDPVLGEGWGGCDEHAGQKLSVQIALREGEDQEFSLGQALLIWRDAMDVEVNGEMGTVVGYSAVDPTVEHSAK